MLNSDKAELRVLGATSTVGWNARKDPKDGTVWGLACVGGWGRVNLA